MRKHSCTIYLEEAAWKQFRLACLTRDTTASHEMAAMIHGRLKEWEAGAPAQPKKATRRKAA